MAIVGIIPCRYGAVRFPGKSLADILGKPMMWHVYQQALKAVSLDAVYIATDDGRIRSACDDLGLNVVMTRSDHASGTDRVAECAGLIDAEVYVNVQGDEPMIDPLAIDAVARGVVDSGNPATIASNGYNEMSDPTDVVDTNVVKVIMDFERRGARLFTAADPLSEGRACALPPPAWPLRFQARRARGVRKAQARPDRAGGGRRDVPLRRARAPGADDPRAGR